MIELRRLRRRWGAFALRLGLAVERGGYTVVLGPSGCGKTLLLHLVAGLHAPDEGQVLLDGRDVTALPPEERGLGLVFQRSLLFPHLDVSENIAFGLRARRVPRAEASRRVEELLASLGLERLARRSTGALSGGEAQRVAIARALAPRPGVLLLDEPLSLLDHNARLELQEELRRIWTDAGVTVLHVTHSRDEARALGRRCAVMLGGRVVQEGPLDRVLACPRCPFVARFLGLTDAPLPAPGSAGCAMTCLEGRGECDGSLEES